jgi:hypothetical protein
VLPRNEVDPVPPITIIWINVVANRWRIKDIVWNDLFHDMVDPIYSEHDIELIKNAYQDIPDWCRAAAVGDILYDIMVLCAFWARRECLRFSSRRICLLTLPRVSPFSVKVIRDAALTVHDILVTVERTDLITLGLGLVPVEDLASKCASIFSVDVRDLPSIHLEDMPIGLVAISRKMRCMRILAERQQKWDKLSDLCVELRLYISDHLTYEENERWLADI